MQAFRRVFLVVFLTAWFADSAVAGIETNPPMPIDKRLKVRPIVVANDAGTNLSTFFDVEPHRTAILNMVDQIWAQAGIDIEWLPHTVVHSSNHLSVTDSTLDNFFTSAQSLGFLSSNSNMIDAFFIQTVNGKTPGAGISGSGLAFRGYNGTAQAIGTASITNPAFYDKAARIVAHELGHNLGLGHPNDNGLTNLMRSSGNNSTEERLTDLQINGNSTNVGARNSEFLVDLPYYHGADFDENGLVDFADLQVWQAGFGGFYTNGDTNFDGDVDGQDFLEIQRGINLSTSLTAAQAVPEPNSLWLSGVGVVSIICWLRRLRHLSAC